MGPGRPTLYDDERATLILEAIAEGNTRECAAGLAGIGKRTLQTWIAQGKAGVEPYTAFAALIKNAEREPERESVGIVRAVARGGQLLRRFSRTDRYGNTTVTEEFSQPNWQAAMTYLERKFGESWSKDAELVRMLKEQREQAEDEGQQLDLSKLSEEQLQILSTWLAETEAEPAAGEPDTVLE